MKFLIPHDKMAAVAKAMHDAEVNVALIERSGPGWIVELLKPPAKDFDKLIRAAGGVIL